MDVMEFRFKILVLGDVGVGKNAFEVYVNKLEPTINDAFQDIRKRQRFVRGASLSALDMDVDEYKIKFLFWVISDSPDFDFLHPAFFSSSKAAILLYDITSASSINRLVEWIPLITKRNDELPIVLAGNKVDIKENRVISREEGQLYQRKYNITSFREISLKTGEGVAEMFEFLRDLLLEKFKRLVE